MKDVAFYDGEVLAIIDASAAAAQRWVQLIAKATGADVNWRPAANSFKEVVWLGDLRDRYRIKTAMYARRDQLQGEFIDPAWSGTPPPAVVDAPVPAEAAR